MLTLIDINNCFKRLCISGHFICFNMSTATISPCVLYFIVLFILKVLYFNIEFVPKVAIHNVNSSQIYSNLYNVCLVPDKSSVLFGIIEMVQLIFLKFVILHIIKILIKNNFKNK